MHEEQMLEYICAAIDTLEQIPDWRSNDMYCSWWEVLNVVREELQDSLDT